MTAYYTLIPGATFATAQLLDEMSGNLAAKLTRARGPVQFPEPLRWRLNSGPPATDWAMGLPPAVLLSSRFREILDDNLGPRDQIQWIESTVERPEGSAIPYWTPHFPAPADVLDDERTQRGPSGVPILWFLAQKKMTGVRVTPIPMMGATLVVDSGVYNLLRREGTTGFQALPTRLTD